MSKFAQVAAQLIVKLTICTNDDMVKELVFDLANEEKGIRIVSFANAHAVMRATREPEFLNNLLKCERLFRDGIGIGLLLRCVGVSPGLNTNGTDLIPYLIDHNPRRRKLALFGTREPRLGKAEQRLRDMGFASIEIADGFQPEEDYVDLVLQKQPAVIVLAMGMPKQEQVAQQLASNAEIAKRNLIIVNGGAIIDIMSGEVPRAPLLMRQLGLEWLFRMLLEPRRMFPRFCDSVVFTVLTLANAKKIRALLKENIHSSKS